MSGYYTVNFNAVYNNVDFRHVVTLTDAEGAAIDVSGATFEMEVKPKVGDDLSAIIELSTGSGISFYTDGTDGKIVLNHAYTAMKLLTPGSYTYDLVKIAGGVTSIVMRGNFKIKLGVTDIG